MRSLSRSFQFEYHKYSGNFVNLDKPLDCYQGKDKSITPIPLISWIDNGQISGFDQQIESQLN